TPTPGTQTSINSLPLGTPVVRTGVTSIVVHIAGPNANTTDNIELIGQGKAVPTGIKDVSFNVAASTTGAPLLSINAHDLDNGGAFSVTDGTSLLAGGQLHVTVSNSQFASLSIAQTGCCAAVVDLENDNIRGPVYVAEGVANGDKIIIDAPTVDGSNQF